MFDDQLNVVNPRIDGRRKMLFVRGSFVEVLNNLLQRDGVPLRLIPEHQPRVKKIGRPVLLA